MRVLIALGLVGLSLGAFGSDVPKAEPKPRPKPEPVAPDWFPCDYFGKVVGLTAKGVVIKPERGLTIYLIKPLPDGTTREWIYVQDNTRPPREFTFQDNLFPDRPGPKTPRGGEHKVADVQVGDIIQISCRQLRGEDYCTALRIHRRPGGKVPPAIGDDELPDKYRVDIRCNAEQFIEEKVIPAFLPKLPRMVPRLRS